jgi:hypothetical protein
MKTLAVRGRFLTGKATFVEADIEMTTNQVAEIYDARGLPHGQRLLSHYRLRTRMPRTGSQGWELFSRWASSPDRRAAARLVCGFCGHNFFIHVLGALGPLNPEEPVGEPQPASYSSNWFRFMHRNFEGPASLSCTHCEQSGEAEVEFPPAA